MSFRKQEYILGPNPPFFKEERTMSEKKNNIPVYRHVQVSAGVDNVVFQFLKWSRGDLSVGAIWCESGPLNCQSHFRAFVSWIGREKRIGRHAFKRVRSFIGS